VKAIILCAGKGTRLRPLTHTAAKHLIPVANKPILFHVIEDVAEAGIVEVGLVVSPDHSDIQEAVGDGRQLSVSVTYIEQKDPRGLAHAVSIAEPFLAGEPFLMFLGDNLLERGVSDFVRNFSVDGTDAALMLYPVEDPRRFGVAVLGAEGRIVRVVEKPAEPPSNLAIAGIYLFGPAVFEAVRRIKPSWRNELEITDAVQYLIDRGGTVKAHMIQGWWKDTGKPADVLDANRLLLETIEPSYPASLHENNSISGRVAIDPTARLDKCTVCGPVMIGAHCRLENSFLGPFTSVSERVTILDSEIENSIIMSDCQVLGVRGRIAFSLLGRHVLLEGSVGRPEVHRLVLGDESQVRVS